MPTGRGIFQQYMFERNFELGRKVLHMELKEKVKIGYSPRVGRGAVEVWCEVP